MKTISILYIATGRYITFWKDFYLSSEKYFLNSTDYEKHYIVFTDATEVAFSSNEHVHVIYQGPLPWPYITLNRFSIFLKAKKLLEKADYIFYFNANMLFIKDVNEELLPTTKQPLLVVKHPGFYSSPRSAFTYETNPDSLAFVPQERGNFYFMGGLNGGLKASYLQLISELDSSIKKDKEKGIIAVWHDESHLNRYACDHQDELKIMEPVYGFPEGWQLPFEAKIIIRNKTNYGGHNYLRGIGPTRKISGNLVCNAKRILIKILTRLAIQGSPVVV